MAGPHSARIGYPHFANLRTYPVVIGVSITILPILLLRRPKLLLRQPTEYNYRCCTSALRLQATPTPTSKYRDLMHIQIELGIRPSASPGLNRFENAIRFESNAQNTARLDRPALPNLPTHHARARPAWATATAVLYASTLRIESQYFDVGGFQFLVWLACVGGRYCNSTCSCRPSQ
jgi:hypothetical protein